MTEPTTIQVRAVNPKPKPAATPRADRPVVHVRSVGATAANVAAAAGEAVFAVGGGVALAAAAGAVVGVPIVVAAARGRLRRPASTSSRTVTNTTGRSGGAMPGNGRARGAGSTGVAGGRLRGLLGGKPGTAAGGGSTGRSRAAGAGPGTPGGAGRPAATKPGGRPKATRGSTSPTGVGRVLGAVGRGVLKGVRGSDKRLADMGNADRRAARKAWKAVRRRFMRKPKPGTLVPTPAAPPKAKKKPKVTNTVRGGTTPATGTPAVTPAPPANPAPINPPTPAATTTSTQPAAATAQLVAASGGHVTGGPAASAMRALLDVVENDMRRIANGYDPEGIEEVLDELAKWPEVLDALGGVWKIMVTKADEDYPFPATATATIEEIQRHQHSVARAAEAVPGLVRAIMRERLEALADKRNAMLDHRANPNTAAI